MGAMLGRHAQWRFRQGLPEMSKVQPDVMCFDVERGLAKALSIKCETFVCGPTDFKIRIGQRWNLMLNRDQLEELWDNADNHSALRDSFASLKAECLVFQSYSK